MTALAAIPDIEITPDFEPTTEAEFLACLASWEWRMFSGKLYKIMIKGDDEDDEVMVAPFVPNAAQKLFLSRLHYRNVILKARQLGFTTLISILWLDHALFNADQRCAIIAHTKDDAAVIFRDKVKFAYNNLPESLKASMPLKRDSATELVFAHNNSALRVAVSVRSATIHRLHVSEMGKVAAKSPDKAKEIVTGAFPAVPSNGVLVVESTAEGQAGEFHRIATTAEKNMQTGNPLRRKHWAFHFFPWWQNPEYAMDPEGIEISPKDHDYFEGIEESQGCAITLRQRAWYIATRDQEQGGDAEMMWREYPSTPDECWRRSTEGTYFAVQLARARVEGRITDLPVLRHVPVNTFWDIGSNDGTAIWLHQRVGTEDRFIDFIEGWELEYAHFIRELTNRDYIYGTHYLPHDADRRIQLGDRIASPLDMLSEIAPRGWRFRIVPRVETLQHGIELTRRKFATAYFDRTRCKEGITHLHQYKKRWNKAQATWMNEPVKADGHTEAADAFRQWAQGYEGDLPTTTSRRRRRGTGLAA